MIKLKALIQDDGSLTAPRTGPSKETEIDPSEICFAMLMTWRSLETYHEFIPAKMGDKTPEGSVLVLLLLMKYIDSDSAGIAQFTSPANYLLITEGIPELINDVSMALGQDWSPLSIFMTHILDSRVSSQMYATFDDKIMILKHGPSDGWINLDLVRKVDGRAIDINNAYGTRNDVVLHTKYIVIADDTNPISDDFKRRCDYKLRERPSKPFKVALPVSFSNGDYPRYWRDPKNAMNGQQIATITNQDWQIRYAHYGCILPDDRRYMLKEGDDLPRGAIPYFEVILNEPVTAILPDGSNQMADYFWVLFPSDSNATVDDMFCMIYRTPAIWQSATIDTMSMIMSFRSGINYADFWFTILDGVKVEKHSLPTQLLKADGHYLFADTNHGHDNYQVIVENGILAQMVARYSVQAKEK